MQIYSSKKRGAEINTVKGVQIKFCSAQFNKAVQNKLKFAWAKIKHKNKVNWPGFIVLENGGKVMTKIKQRDSTFRVKANGIAYGCVPFDLQHANRHVTTINIPHRKMIILIWTFSRQINPNHKLVAALLFKSKVAAKLLGINATRREER